MNIMTKIQIKNRFDGSIIYEYEAENATVKDAAIDAVKSEADLIGANLREADLSGADLTGANLIGANLSGAIKVPMYCKWSYGITEDKIHIGCEKRTIADWDAFFASNEVLTTERNTPEFKQIQAVYEGLKAYYQFLNK